MVGEEAGQTRYTRRNRTLSTKALEREQRKNETRDSDDSYETNTEDAINAQLDAPKAPAPKRMQSRPRTPSQATKRGRPEGNGIAKEDPLSMILAAIAELKTSNMELKSGTRSLISELAEVKSQLEETNEQLAVTKEQLAKTETQLAEIISNTSSGIRSTSGEFTPSTGSVPNGSPTQSYASVLAGAMHLPASVKSFPTASALFCTIDTSRVEGNVSETEPGKIRQAIEREIRTTEDQAAWRCVAVNKDPRNPTRIRIVCRSETELLLVKDAAQKTIAAGARVLKDQLYPVKVDNANRTAILDKEGNLLPGTVEELGQENDVKIAKVSWLSKKDQAKAYGSMVVYVTSSNDATRLLQGQYFHVAGESAYVRVFETRERPLQCYKCQKLGHKAYSCPSNQQVCAKCAETGHHHRECVATIPKCVPCGGPHESFSKNCRVLFPLRHE